MKCSNCGFEFNDGIFCPECGFRCEDSSVSISEKVTNDYEENITSSTTNKKKNDGLISMIAGIIAIPLAFSGIGAIISLPLSVLGIVFGIRGIKTEKRTFAIIGLILSCWFWLMLIAGLLLMNYYLDLAQ